MMHGQTNIKFTLMLFCFLIIRVFRSKFPCA